MINLLVSKYQAQNSKIIYKAICNKLSSNEKSFLIVPEQFTLQTDIDFINYLEKNTGKHTTIDAKVLSFSSFSRFILQRLGGLKKNLITDIGKNMLITGILTDLNDNLKVFKNNSINEGFIENISKLISELKEENINCDSIDEILSKDMNKSMKDKLEDINLIYKNYEKVINGKYVDNEDRLLQVIEEISKSDFLKEYNFYFDNFTDMSAQQIDLIKELEKIGANITISSVIDPVILSNVPFSSGNFVLFDTSYNFIRKLKDCFSVKTYISSKDNEISKDINHLLDNFLSFDPNPYSDSVDNIFFVENKNTEEEIENLAIFINKKIKKDGLKYNDISISVSNYNEYENIIEKIFKRYNIPYFIDKSYPLSDNNIIKSIISYLNLSVFDFKKDDLFFFVTSPLFNDKNITNEDKYSFINYINTRKIKHKMFLDDKYFILDEKFYENDLKLLEYKNNELKSVNKVRDKILNNYNDFYEFSKNKATFKEFSIKVFELISTDEIKEGIINYQNRLKKDGELDLYEQIQQVWEKFINCIEQLVDLLSDRKTSFSNYYKIFFAGLKNIEIGIIPPSKDQISIGNFTRSKQNSRKIQYFIGLNDLYFPSREDENKILKEEELENLKQNNINIRSTKNNKVDFLNFYKLASNAKKLFISYSYTNKDGEALGISREIIQIKNDIFPNIRMINLFNLGYNNLLYSKDLFSKKIFNNLWRLKKNEEISNEDKKYTISYLNFLREKDIIEIFNRGLFYNNNKKNVSKDLIKDYSNKKMSVSEIDSYAKCPYKHFMEYVIKPHIKEDYDINALEVGSLVHSNIQRVTNEIKDNYNIDENGINEFIEKNFDKDVNLNLDTIRKNDKKNNYLLQNIKEETKKSSSYIKKQLESGKFKIEDTEKWFGENSNYPQVKITDDIIFEGRIDRIDRYKDYIRIIDYKTGNKEFVIKDVLNGIDMQLLIYMMSIEESGFIGCGTFYISLKDTIRSIDDENLSKKNLDEFNTDKYKMEGLILDNIDSINAMDENYSNTNLITVFSLKGRAKKDISKCDNVLDKKEIEKINNHLKKLIKKFVDDMRNGNIKLNPIKTSKFFACDYCDYKSICKFDNILDKFRIRIPEDIKLKDLK